MRPWILAETNYQHVKDAHYEVAVLPLGATEPHNFHLPYGTDLFEGTKVGELICEEAHRKGGRVVLLPTVPYGTETNMKDFPLAINVQPTTLFRFLMDIMESVSASGVKKIVLLNSHGGNDMKPLLREVCGKLDAQVFLCNWYLVIKDIYNEIFQEQDDHAGEMETSFALAYFPELVLYDATGALAGDAGATRPSRFEAIRKGWVSITRNWKQLTTNTGSGNPHHASAEKAKRMMEVLVERLGTFLAELSASPMDEKFPF